MSKRSTADILATAMWSDPEGDHPVKNAVDALFAIADALKGLTYAVHCLGNGNAATPMGAIEAHSVAVSEAVREMGKDIAAAIAELAPAIEELAP